MRPIAGLLPLLLLAACSAGAPAPAAAPSPEAQRAGSRCTGLGDLGRQARFATPAGTQLVGVELGTGAKGVVLAHQNGSNLCEWLPFGQRLAGLGYRVLAFDFGGDGDSGPHRGDDRLDDDVVAAATHLRANGVTDVVLMGASKGGTASLSAAAALRPAPAAVVSLSAPGLFAGISAADAVPLLKSPALFLAAENDHPFAEAAQQFDASAPKSVPHQVYLSIGAEHGTGLLGGGEAKKVNELIEAFLREHAPAR
ncbi:alpha/beta hydrolase family protein [Dactylosporangium darangshiense]|uniref:Serine aminopeptidase S33 domain-containing protein n=1 Tax=Dactylosporangium darangshiense TaxID=579108 RepID=A0ABP8DPW5_9ACTN